MPLTSPRLPVVRLLEAADSGAAVLILAVVGAAILGAAVLTFSAVVPARARRAAAGGSLAGVVVWLLVVVAAPPIPATIGWALTAAGLAAIVAVPLAAGPSGTTAGTLIAGLLAVAGTMLSIFVTVLVLAHWGPDALIPDVTPQAPAARRIAESRIEIVDPYIMVLVLAALAATAMSLTAVLARRSGKVRPG
ncbi:hypothetical protein Aph02nite_27410 [Actinoplanes philippinensis]|uniref:Uncharacterized protein n=1 Tax=Actinoplanes philippinensis TaxID=35752 RepID=A0A1I2GAW7_9ACTN|nr:hypothetical protein [Actinoplanes philippinensis]GIE76791.1 hypothetical protein Aph02nite_27410 [Actinoplanes philippinensis]SFF14725.1 hypothetical protein SAMN05421541_106396 [Actinoplanes philippinensis]